MFTYRDLPDPYENPAAWFSGLAMLPSADGGPSLAESLAVSGGSLWWLVDYWCYEGAYTGVHFTAAMSGTTSTPGTQRRQFLDKAKRWREHLRAGVGLGVRGTLGDVATLMVTQSTYRGVYHTGESIKEGDIHLGPVRDVLQDSGSPYLVLERDTRRNFSLIHPSGDKHLVPAHLVLNAARRVRSTSCLAVKDWVVPDEVPTQAKNWLNTVLNQLCRSRIWEAQDWYHGAVTFLRRVKPKTVLITDEADMFGRAFLTAARSLNIKTIALQHGIFYKGHYGYTNHPQNRQGKGSLPFADQTCVYGEGFADVLEQYGLYQKNEIVVTGNPRFDYCESLKVEHKKTGVMLATQPLSELLRKQIFECAGAAAESLGEPLIVKIHPGDRMADWYERESAKLSVDSTIVRDADLLGLLVSASIMVTGNSTVVIEASRMDCDTVCFASEELIDPLGYVQCEAALAVGSPAEIRDLVPLSTEQKKRLAEGRSQLLHKYAIKTDRAASTVAALCNTVRTAELAN